MQHLRLPPAPSSPLRSLSHHDPTVAGTHDELKINQPPIPTATKFPPNLDVKYRDVPGVRQQLEDLDASIYFVGTATTIIQHGNMRIMTDPNFLHAGDHVHLGPGVTGTRLTNPAIDIEALPPIDLVLLSHYHADHFDQLVEDKLRRDLPIITTPHAKAVLGLDFWNGCLVDKPGEKEERKALKVTAMPGKHVPDGLIGAANDLLGAVPPTNGWMLELGSVGAGNDEFSCGYRIYISGDTLLVDELKEIPKRYASHSIDLMLIHLGGTTIPSPKMPLLMVTMDAKQGIELINLVKPEVTIPIHFDDYDVFASPLEDFKKAVEEAGLGAKVVFLDRKEEYRFKVR
ncbi:Metallo-hydrolase/oxidoreductase [Atractiella rhizophila]|nr:Metallo-hydrolase/oxidoreductase [Atractiella rhizophila]